MPRTFTLAGLMLGVTLIAILCGLAINNPGYALVLALFAPLAIVSLTLVSFAHRRALVLTATFVGALVGFLFAPVAFMRPRGDPTTIWPHVQRLVTPIAIYATLGALVVGLVTLAVGDLLDSRYPPR